MNSEGLMEMLHSLDSEVLLRAALPVLMIVLGLALLLRRLALHRRPGVVLGLVLLLAGLAASFIAAGSGVDAWVQAHTVLPQTAEGETLDAAQALSAIGATLGAATHGLMETVLTAVLAALIWLVIMARPLLRGRRPA